MWPVLCEWARGVRPIGHLYSPLFFPVLYIALSNSVSRSKLAVIFKKHKQSVLLRERYFKTTEWIFPSLLFFYWYISFPSSSKISTLSAHTLIQRQHTTDGVVLGSARQRSLGRHQTWRTHWGKSAWPRPGPASSKSRWPAALKNSNGMRRELAFANDKFLTEFQFFGMENQQLPVTKCTNSSCRIHKCGQFIYFESKCG